MLSCHKANNTPQKYSRLITTLLVILTFILFSQVTHANLMISPTRVLIEDRERVETIHLINSSGETRSYRIEFSELKIDESGNYQEITKETDPGFPFASDYLRFSPSKVTLEPGERQAIKVLARRPQNLPAGDYRSHLNFIALPPKREEDNNVNGIRMRLDVLMSYSIPVVMRRGEVSFEGKITAVSVQPIENSNIAEITVKMSRSGTSTAYGRLVAQFKREDSNEIEMVGELNGVNFFPDQATQERKIMWASFDSTPKGRLYITYEGQEELTGKLLAGGQIILD